MAIKKHWYEIVAPKMFGEKVVGETLAVDPKYLIGRKITASLVEISQDYSRFFIKAILQIERVEGSRAYTKFVGHDIMRERVYRMVQRYSRRVDVIQDVATKDGKELRVKTVFVLVRPVGTSIKKSARALAGEIIEKAAKQKNFEEFVETIIRGDLQKQVRKAASKVYPVGNVEIRKTELMEKKAVAA